jgi:FkbH-like protein
VTASPIYFIADFNVEMLARQMANSVLPGSETRIAPFGRVIEALGAGSPGPQWMGVVWTRPASISLAFHRALNGERVDTASVVEDTRAYAAAIARFAARTAATFVPTFVLPSWQRGYGPLDYRPGLGISDLLSRMNLTLAESLSSVANVFVLDAGRWMATIGPRAWSDKLWYATKSPFTLAAFDEAAQDIGAAIAGLAGRARRIVIVDLDNVLWGGSIGEVGWEALRLGGHDHAGEAFADFQRALKTLTRRGVLLAIASKNDEAPALEAIDRHPEMQLRLVDFAAWKIDWRDKGQNVRDLLDAIRLGPESAVFIDDSPIERARVADAVPGVLVPEWPEDPSKFCEALAKLRCFDAPTITAEDRARSAMYAAQRTRAEAECTAGSLDNWLTSLDITVTADALSDGNLDRAAQLLNKTNQMNLATRRLAGADLLRWAAQPQHAVITFRVADRFGDSGLTGLIGLACDGRSARLTDFLVSCRVLGRGVEETLLHVAINHARAQNAVELVAEFVPTDRNKPCLEFFRRSGLRADGDGRFVWNTAEPYPPPPYIVIRDNAAAAVRNP